MSSDDERFACRICTATESATRTWLRNSWANENSQGFPRLKPLDQLARGGSVSMWGWVHWKDELVYDCEASVQTNKCLLWSLFWFRFVKWLCIQESVWRDCHENAFPDWVPSRLISEPYLSNLKHYLSIVQHGHADIQYCGGEGDTIKAHWRGVRRAAFNGVEMLCYLLIDLRWVRWYPNWRCQSMNPQAC